MQRDQAHPPAWAVFTDGSCWHKDRVGGWAWVAFSTNDEEEQFAQATEDTTISRMELAAPLDFLGWLYMHQGPSNVLVFSDSEYVVKGVTDRTRARTCNNDLWRLLDEWVDRHEHVEFEHVRGHADSYYNHEADRLAGASRKKLQSVHR